jgi:hypothetical protein
MSRNNPTSLIQELSESGDLNPVIESAFRQCGRSEHSPWSIGSFRRFTSRESGSTVLGTFEENWAESVPLLLANVFSLVAEKKKQEIRFSLLQIAFKGVEERLSRLELAQATIIPINSFSPEPYDLLKTILVSVRCVEGGFNAGWFDANIHSSGDNEEEAVGNLKSLILDFF